MVSEEEQPKVEEAGDTGKSATDSLHFVRVYLLLFMERQWLYFTTVNGKRKAESEATVCPTKKTKTLNEGMQKRTYELPIQITVI